MPTDITPDKLEEIQNSGETWILDFWADWCQPCKKLAPVFEEVSGDVDGVNFGKINIEDHQDLAQKFGVRAIPTMVIVRGEDELDRKSGALGKEDLESWVREYA
ncbi:MAG: thioredoxin family protein [Candidatus Nanohaloarchaea archaeon]